jgi:hypothetical protein
VRSALQHSGAEAQQHWFVIDDKNGGHNAADIKAVIQNSTPLVRNLAGAASSTVCIRTSDAPNRFERHIDCSFHSASKAEAV